MAASDVLSEVIKSMKTILATAFEAVLARVLGYSVVVGSQVSDKSIRARKAFTADAREWPMLCLMAMTIHTRLAVEALATFNTKVQIPGIDRAMACSR